MCSLLPGTEYSVIKLRVMQPRWRQSLGVVIKLEDVITGFLCVETRSEKLIVTYNNRS